MMSSITDSRDVGGWPILLTLESACRYLSLEKAQFLAIAVKWKVMPIQIDGEELRWRQKNLNRMIDRLPIAPEFSMERIGAAGFNLDDATIDRLALIIASRLQDGGLPSIQSGPALLSIKDTARQLGVGRSTIYKRINDGSLGIRRIGGQTLVTRDSINALL